MRTLFMTGVVLVLVAACAMEQPVAPASPPDRVILSQAAPTLPPMNRGEHAITAGGEESESAEQTSTNTQAVGDFELEPATWDPNAFIRPRRRMNIDQLDQAIRDATGGIGWDNPQWPHNSLWTPLRPTLGVPDFYRSVHEDLTPNLVFQKFLADAAEPVCNQLLLQEQQVPADQRVFLVAIDPTEDPNAYPQKTDANLQMLLMRFHGKDYDVTDPALVPWRWLVTYVASQTDTIDAWRAVCATLILHPDFYSY